MFIKLDLLPVWVKKQYLLNFEGGWGEYVPGKLQSVWSYTDSMPTFTVLLDDGSLFSYLPASAFAHRGGVACSEGVDAFYSCNTFAPSTNFVKYEVEVLKQKGKIKHVFGPDKDYVGIGDYFFTLECPEENELVHLLQVAGQLYFVPNHKLMVGDSVMTLPKWKKLRSCWTKQGRDNTKNAGKS